MAALPPKRKSSFGLKKDPLTQTGITSFFNAKEGGVAAPAFKSALELSNAKEDQQGRYSIADEFGLRFGFRCTGPGKKKS